MAVMAAGSALQVSGVPAASFSGDVVIYGGTSSAVISAIRAAKSGKKVYLVSPDLDLGAMSTSGLGMTDSGKTA